MKRVRGEGRIAALCLALAACGGGGGGSGAAAVVEFAGTGSSGAEGGGAIDIAVRLRLFVPELLADVTVDVVDAGSGVAASGGDYASFAPTTLTFAAGSLDGETRTVTLTPSADTLAEGPETVLLRLQSATGGAALGAGRSHVLAIEDAQVVSVAFSAPSSAAPDESTLMRDVPLTLSLPPGATLERELGMQVVDAGSGSATAGVDYAVFGSRTVTFPAGATNGTVRSVQIQVQDDLSIEGDETVALALSDTHLFAEVGANGAHTLTITEDDLAVGAHFVATGNGGGLASGQVLGFGAQANGSGTSSPTTIVLANMGGTTMSMDAPTLSGNDVEDFVVEVTAASLAAPAAGLAPASVVSPLTVVGEDAAGTLILAFDEASFAEVRVAGASVLVEEFALPGGERVQLELERLPSPWTSDARIAIDGVDSALHPTQLTGPLAMFRGRIRGRDGSSAFVSFSNDGARGWVNDGAGSMVHLAAGEETGAMAISAQAAASFGALPPDPAEFCGGEAFPPGVEPTSGMLAPAAQSLAPGAVTVSECRLAIETDFQFFQKFNNATTATTYVTELVAAVADRYLSDVQTTLSIAYLGIHTTATDPWATPDIPGNTVMMLDEFVTAWSPTSGSGWPASADLAHFLSGASIGGGRAYIGTLCSQTLGFGVSGVYGNSNWSAFPTQSSFLNWDFVVVAHELGHNFNARHTHSYCPPIDQCSSDNCNGTQICSRGTLMSYCHTCPGGLGNTDLVFHPHVANEMRVRVNSSCLAEASLPGGSEVTYEVRFRPTSGVGAKSATMSIVHSAANAPSPFTIGLSGTSQ